MKIYTRNGDKGKTQLLGGTVVEKNNNRIECYGSIDELNAHIGNLHDQEIPDNIKKTLFIIQNKLFDMGSNIAYDQKNKNIELPILKEKDLKYLEEVIDELEKELPMLSNFILPSGDKTASLCHICRTVCRRAERRIVSIHSDLDSNNLNLKYLNRLSDFLFVLSRYLLKINNGQEINWEKNL
mgnify:FL=1